MITYFTLISFSLCSALTLQTISGESPVICMLCLQELWFMLLSHRAVILEATVIDKNLSK